MSTRNRSRQQNVGIVVQDNYPLDRDVRTRKMAKSLDTSGYSVNIFARNSLDDPDMGKIRETHLARSETLSYARVRRFSWFLETRLFRLLTANIPVNPLWMLWLTHQFWVSDTEIVVACDVRAGIPAIVAAKLQGLPVVLDLRENFAELARIKPVTRPLEHLILNVTLVSAVELTTVKLADHVWVVTKERKDALVEEDVPPSKISVVRNTPYRRETKEFKTTAEEDEGRFDWKEFTLVYVGSLNQFRGLDQILEGISYANRDEENAVHFAIAGDGPDRDRLERRCRQLDIEDYVHFVGWIDPETIPAFLDSGDVGVVPHVVNRYTNQTIPNKLFDYMMAGLPVLTTPTAPVARVVRSVDCGQILPPEAGVGAIAETISEMRDAQRRRR